MEPEDPQKSAEEFLKRMERGDFDGNVSEAVKKLSRAPLEKIAEILMARSSKPHIE